MQYEHTRTFIELHSHSRVMRIEGAHPRFGQLISVTTSKAFGEPAGSFTITMQRQRGKQPALLSLFDEAEGIWCRIVWVLRGRRYDGLWGSVDSIHEDTARADSGEEKEVVTITGRDIGKPFGQTPLFINIHERDGILPVIPLYTAISDRLIGRPDEIIRTLLDGWLGNNGVADKMWLLPSSVAPGHRYFFDWLNTRTISPNLRGTIVAPTLLNVDAQRNLWDSMQEYSNGVLNEMWVDLAPDPDLPNAARRLDALRPALIMRERPFPTRVSRARWDALPVKRIRATEMKKRSLSLDGTSRFNYWSLYSQGSSASNFSLSAIIQQQSGRPAGQPGNVPIYDLDSIRKHGLRKYEQTTRFLPIDDRSGLARDAAPHSNADFWLRVAVQWLRIIHDWYVIAPKQQTGQLELALLRPDIRLGDRVIEERLDGSEWEYYVESVTNEYSYPNRGRTVLLVTRGQRVGTDHLVRQYARYAGLDTSTLSDEDMTEAEIATADDAGAPPTDQGEERESEQQTIVESAIVIEPDLGEERDLTDADFEPSAPLDDNVFVFTVGAPEDLPNEAPPEQPALGPRGAERSRE